MRKFRIIFAIISSFFITGCTITYTVPVVNINAMPPAVMTKIPLNVAISIPDEAETISTPIQPDIIAVFPIGQLVKKTSQDIFPQVFDKAMLIKGKYYPPDVNALFVAKVKELKGYQPYCGIAGCRIDLTMSMDFTLLDAKGVPLWGTSVNSSKTKKDPSPISSRPIEGEAAAELVNEIFQKAVEEMLMSREIYNYASTKDKPEIVASKPPHETPSPFIKSDIDELPAIKAKPNKNAYAIVIGIENYRQKLPKADFATSDAKTVTEYLTKVMGYPEENVVTLINDRALKSDMEKYLEKWLSNNVEKDGSVFIYYSGHGAPNPKTGDAYLVPYDGDPSFIDETGYSLKRMYAALGKLPAKEVIVALDSCFSGAGGRSVLAKGARPLVMTMESSVIPSKVAVLSAASGDQISSTYDEKGHGLFTYFMLKGIKGEGDTNGDGKIEIGELFEYIKPQVERIARKTYNNEQSPQMIAPAELIKRRLIEK